MEDLVLEYNILNTVHESEGNITQRNISQKIGRSVASVNFALRLLAVKGYIKISGANPRNLRYHLTPGGVVQKSVLAYNFLKRQRALYNEVRNQLLAKLTALLEEGVTAVAIYGWTPFTEAAILFLISEGMRVTALYTKSVDGIRRHNRIPVKLIGEFQEDCQVLVLMEPLPVECKPIITIRIEECFPVG